MSECIPPSSVDVLKSALIYYLKESSKSGRIKSRPQFIRELHDWEGMRSHFRNWYEEFDPYQDFKGGHEDEEDNESAIKQSKFDLGLPITVAVLDNWIKGQKQKDGSHKITIPSVNKLYAIADYLMYKNCLDRNWPEKSNLAKAVTQLSINLQTESINFPLELDNGNDFVSENFLNNSYRCELLNLNLMNSPGIVSAYEELEQYNRLPNEALSAMLSRIERHEYNSKKIVDGVGAHLSEQTFKFFVECRESFYRNIYTWTLGYIRDTETQPYIFDMEKEDIFFRESTTKFFWPSHYNSLYSYNNNDYINERSSIIIERLGQRDITGRKIFRSFWEEEFQKKYRENVYAFRSGERLTEKDLIMNRLFSAAESGNIVALKDAIKDGADPNLINTKYGTTPLLAASRNNAALAVKYLIEECNADPLQVDECGNLPSLCAGDESLITYLIEVEIAEATRRGVDYKEIRLARKNRPPPEFSIE